MLLHDFLFGLTFSLISLAFSDEDYYHVSGCCIYKGPRFEDIEYILTYRYNKHTVLVYNSTTGNFTGFTSFAMEIAKQWENPHTLMIRQSEKSFLCDSNLKTIQIAGGVTVSPTIKLKSVKKSDGKRLAMLVCSAYDFYPKDIRVTWLRDGQEVTDGVSYSGVMSDGDFYYQFQSHLEYFPTSGEKLTCMVEHFSLSEPKLVDWDDSLPAEEKIQIIVGLCGLVAGLAVLSFGLMFSWKKASTHSTVCRG